jgi:hypothetical protein
MNERIKELAEQAGYLPDMFGIGHWDMPECKKFAELIIKECAEVILKWKKEPFPFDEDTAVSIIHEHFGIELPPKTIRVIKI